MRHILLAALFGILVTPAHPDPIAGADDPAFRAPFDRALQGDAPTALADLHAAAEAGNQAALRALPSVLLWLPPTGTLADRNRFRHINGTRLQDAITAVWPTAAALADGKITTPEGLLDRARTLAAAGEPRKAALLVEVFLNTQDPSLPPPADLLTLPATALTLGLYLADLYRVADPAVTDPVLTRALQENHLAGWIAVARILGKEQTPSTDLKTTPRIAALVQAAGIDRQTASARLTEAALVADLSGKPPLLIPRAQAETAARLLRDTAEFLPLRSLCAAACPNSMATCEAASIQAFGYPHYQGESAVPDHALIPLADFYSTPRGAKVILAARLPRMQRGELFPEILDHVTQTDACLAKVIADATPP